MSPKRPHIERVSPGDYDKFYPERLSKGDLNEQSMFSLLVRSHGDAFEAFMLKVNLEEIQQQAGAVALKTVLLDADLRPATQQIDSRINQANLWSSKTLRLLNKGRSVPVRDGFFVSSQPDEIDWSLLELTNLDQQSLANV